MSKYEINDPVYVVGSPENIGFIQRIEPDVSGQIFYGVTFQNGNYSTHPELQIRKFIPFKNAWQLLASNQCESYEKLSLVSTFHKVRNSTNNTLSTLLASRTIFKPYQYKPLVKLLNSPTRKILIADEVGLGKTIEAGHILLELAGRQELKNALIVCPKSLKEKWKFEMEEKFNFYFKIMANRKELVSALNHSIATGEDFKAIVTYDNVRVKPMIEDNSIEQNPFLQAIESAGLFFDLLICDEAHYLRNINLRHRGIKKVLEVSKACVFLTATPLMTGIENLYNLIKLIDEKAYYRWEEFQNAVSINKPFIKAVSRLNKKENLLEIHDELINSEVPFSVSIGEEFRYANNIKIGDYFAKDPLFNRVTKNLQSGNSDYSILTSIQKDLTDLNSLNHIYTRTRKREVTTDGSFTTRTPHSYMINLTAQEREAYDEVINIYDGVPLALVSKKRQITSCLPAYYSTEEESKSGITSWLGQDSKFDKFKTIVNEVVHKNGRKLIVFAFFRKTLLYLKNRLEREGIKCILLYGPTEDRQAVINQFRDDASIKVFLSSQVGTEGVDLQFCNALVNYDLPWNPMVVEQRIGRIDRIGQKEPLIHIYNLVLENTIEEQIYYRLLDRIHIFQETIGDLESILADDDSSFDKVFKNLEIELYSKELSTNQQNDRIETTTKALIRQRTDLDEIKTELTDSMVNDVFFQNAINQIYNNKQYITEFEIKKFIQWLCESKLGSIILREISESLYELDFVDNNFSRLLNFITENIDLDSNRNLKYIQSKFKNANLEKRKIQLTFNQDYARENPQIEYINAYHPLTIAIANFIEKQKLHVNQVFQAHLSILNASGENFNAVEGDYLMAVYKITVTRKNTISNKSFEYLYPVIISFDSDEGIQILNDDDAAFLNGKVQQFADRINEFAEFDSDFIEYITPTFTQKLRETIDKFKEEEEIKIESYKIRSTKQIDQYYSYRIERIEEQINANDSNVKVLPMWNSNLLQIQNEYRERKESLLETRVDLDNTLVSITYFEIN
jgi:SNF2 family DNA or RNA helicase